MRCVFFVLSSLMTGDSAGVYSATDRQVSELYARKFPHFVHVRRVLVYTFALRRCVSDCSVQRNTIPKCINRHVPQRCKMWERKKTHSQRTGWVDCWWLVSTNTFSVHFVSCSIRFVCRWSTMAICRCFCLHGIFSRAALTLILTNVHVKCLIPTLSHTPDDEYEACTNRQMKKTETTTTTTKYLFTDYWHYVGGVGGSKHQKHHHFA